MTGRCLESSVLRRHEADGLEAATAESAPDIQTPEGAVLDAERRRTFSDLLAGLPAQPRRLIKAAFFEGYTHSEFAPFSDGRSAQ